VRTYLCETWYGEMESDTYASMVGKGLRAKRALDGSRLFRVVKLLDAVYTRAIPSPITAVVCAEVVDAQQPMADGGVPAAPPNPPAERIVYGAEFIPVLTPEIVIEVTESNSQPAGMEGSGAIRLTSHVNAWEDADGCDSQGLMRFLQAFMPRGCETFSFPHSEKPSVRTGGRRGRIGVQSSSSAIEQLFNLKTAHSGVHRAKTWLRDARARFRTPEYMILFRFADRIRAEKGLVLAARNVPHAPSAEEAFRLTVGAELRSDPVRFACRSLPWLIDGDSYHDLHCDVLDEVVQQQQCPSAGELVREVVQAFRPDAFGSKYMVDKSCLPAEVHAHFAAFRNIHLNRDCLLRETDHRVALWMTHACGEVHVHRVEGSGGARSEDVAPREQHHLLTVTPGERPQRHTVTAASTSNDLYAIQFHDIGSISQSDIAAAIAEWAETITVREADSESSFNCSPSDACMWHGVLEIRLDGRTGEMCATFVVGMRCTEFTPVQNSTLSLSLSILRFVRIRETRLPIFPLIEIREAVVVNAHLATSTMLEALADACGGCAAKSGPRVLRLVGHAHRNIPRRYPRGYVFASLVDSLAEPLPPTLAASPNTHNPRSAISAKRRRTHVLVVQGESSQAGVELGGSSPSEPPEDPSTLEWSVRLFRGGIVFVVRVHRSSSRVEYVDRHGRQLTASLPYFERVSSRYPRIIDIKDAWLFPDGALAGSTLLSHVADGSPRVWTRSELERGAALTSTPYKRLVETESEDEEDVDDDLRGESPFTLVLQLIEGAQESSAAPPCSAPPGSQREASPPPSDLCAIPDS